MDSPNTEAIPESIRVIGFLIVTLCAPGCLLIMALGIDVTYPASLFLTLTIAHVSSLAYGRNGLAGELKGLWNKFITKKDS